MATAEERAIKPRARGKRMSSVLLNFPDERLRPGLFDFRNLEDLLLGLRRGDASANVQLVAFQLIGRRQVVALCENRTNVRAVPPCDAQRFPVRPEHGFTPGIVAFARAD